MKRSVAIPLATAFIWCAAASAHAHHAYAIFFDLCTSVTIEGRVETVQWKDPHVMIDLTTDQGTAYKAEWTSLRALTNRGITTDVLKAGDRVAVTGSPMKDPAQMTPEARALVRNPTLKIVSALTRVRRARDNSSWTREPASTRQPECRGK